MTLKLLVTEKVTHEVLSRVLTLLSATSAPLSPEQRTTIVTAAMKQHSGLRYTENNDLGACIARMLDNCLFAHVETPAALEQHYPALLQDDPITSVTIDRLVTGIATAMATPLYEICNIMPKDAKALSAAITNRLPKDLRSDGPAPLHQFSWGKLGHQHHRLATVLFAKDRVNCFRSTTPQHHDTINILRVLPLGVVLPTANIDMIRPLLMQAINTATQDESADQSLREYTPAQKTLALDILLSPKTYRQQITGMTESLGGKHIASVVLSVTSTIDAVEDLLRCITASALTAINNETQVSVSDVMDNLDVVFTNLMLLRAAMLYPQDLLKNQLLLSPNTVQAEVFNEFCAAGGTEDVVQIYLSHIQLNNDGMIPSEGVSADIIHKTYDRARESVQKHDTRLRNLTTARKMKALYDTTENMLITHYQTGCTTGQYRDDLHHLHNDQMNKALSGLMKRSLDDIAVEYLVGMKNDTLYTGLYRSIQSELLELVKTNTEIKSMDVSYATCSAVMKTLLTRITDRFAVAV
jgi:hypothetical protein